jgi:hypothetical protein
MGMPKAPSELSCLGRMLMRKPRMLVAIALANKMARSVWAMMRKLIKVHISFDVLPRQEFDFGRYQIGRALDHVLFSRRWWPTSARCLIVIERWRSQEDNFMNDTVFGFMVAAELSALFWAGIFLFVL